MVSGAGWLERGRASGRPETLTVDTCRQRRGPGTSAAVAEEHCTVERTSDLTYAEFIQQYVRPPVLATPPTPENPSRSSQPGSMLSRFCLPAVRA